MPLGTPSPGWERVPWGFRGLACLTSLYDVEPKEYWAQGQSSWGHQDWAADGSCWYTQRTCDQSKVGSPHASTGSASGARRQGVSAVRSTHPPGPRPTQVAAAAAGELLTQHEIHCPWHARCPLLGAWESHLGSFFTIPITHLLACAVQVSAKSSRAWASQQVFLLREQDCCQAATLKLVNWGWKPEEPEGWSLGPGEKAKDLLTSTWSSRR